MFDYLIKDILCQLLLGLKPNARNLSLIYVLFSDFMHEISVP